MSRQRLLFLSHVLPDPPDDGVRIRTHNVLRLLAQEYDVTALCFFRRATHGTEVKVEDSLRELQTLAEIEAFPIPQEWSRPRLLLDHMRSLASQRVYTAFAYKSDRFRSRLRTLLRDRSFDLVHLESLDLSDYLPELGHTVVVCGHHNVESQLLLRRALHDGNLFRRRYLQIQGRLMQQEERRWMPQIALNLAVSANDKAAFESLAPGSNVAVVPNGVDTRHFRPMGQPQKGIVFVGGWGWFPNRDALHFFAKDILPYLRGRGNQPRVRWVGHAPEDVRSHYRSQGIELTGFVKDTRPIVASAACYVVPLRVGGGTRLKILEAWAMGKAVVSTSVGCEGLDAHDGRNILIRNDPASFAEAVNLILTDEGLRTSLGHAALATARDKYDWQVVAAEMHRCYRVAASEQA